MKLNKKIILVTLSILLLSLALNAAVNIVNFRRNYTEALLAGSLGLGQSVNGVLTEMLHLGLPLATLSGMNKKLVQLLHDNPHVVYAGIADRAGRVLFHSDPGLIGRRFTDPVMQRSLAALQPVTQLYDRFDGHQYYDVTIPVFASATEHVGAIRLGFRTEVVGDKVRWAMAQVLLNSAITFVVVGVLVNYLLARLVSQPVIALSEQARRISAGDFSAEVVLRRTDEIGALSDAVNQMSRTIRDQLAAAQRSRDELEDLVRTRTGELERSNGQLQETNQALNAKTEALLHSNADLDQFAYSVSHDMRQPLRMVSAHLQLLARGLKGKLDADNRENLDYALDGARRMDAMIVSLLDYSRVGRKFDAKQWLASRDSLDEALNFLAPAIEEAQATVEVGGDWPRVHASGDELTRLLQNLIGNAIHYHEPGQPPRVTVDSALDGATWRVAVRDQGIGIEPQQIGRLFQFFSRLQSRQRFEGTGMGLALCRRIVEHHQGRIWAESEGPGRGSRFVFEMPVQVAEEAMA